MKLSLQRDSDLPLYRQVADQIREHIQTGTLAPGVRLPPVRELSKQLHLTRLTVHSAYAELQSEGLVESFVGKGTYVAERTLPQIRRPSSVRPAQLPAPWLSQGFLGDMLRMAGHPGLLSFAQAFPSPETYPLRDLQRGFRAALEDPNVMSYGPPQGEATLREQIAHVLLDRGVVVTPDMVLVTAGAQQGLDLALRAFTTPNDVIFVEEPTYPGFIELVAQRGQRIVGIPMDRHGLRVDVLERLCREHRPRLLYTVATFHNPTGTTLSADRRGTLLQLAQTYDFLIVEDDAYGLLSYEQPAPAALKADDTANRVVFVTSFSKTLMPGLRLGAIVAGDQQLPALLAAKRSTDMFTAAVLQRALADYLRRHYFGVHLQRVRALYVERRDTMLAALKQYLPECSWTYPVGGLSIWVTLPEGVSDRDLYLEGIERGIGITPGRVFFSQPGYNSWIRLSFGAHPPEQIEQGMAILGQLVQEQLAGRLALATRAYREGSPLI